MVKTAALFLLALTVLAGIAYCAAITLAANLVAPDSARGGLVRVGERIVGAENVGQAFSAPGYFWGRPSAGEYATLPSSGSNLGPLHPRREERIRARVASLRAADPARSEPIPLDLVTASGSGLDPHVSLAAALWQVPRVARARGLDEATLRAFVTARVEGPAFGLFGVARVDVLRLNLALPEAGP